MDQNTKSLFASKTFWGAVVALLCPLVGIVFKVSLTDQDQASVVDALSLIGTAIGSLTVVVGRMTATQGVHLVAPPAAGGSTDAKS